GITVNLAAGTVTANDPLDLSIGADTLRSVEAVRGTNFADTYSAIGFNGTSINAGSLGTFNNFDGAGGNDTIIGNGNTRIQYSNALAAVTVDIALGTAQGTAPGDASNTGTDTFSGVNSVMGSMFDDTLSGSGNSETFMGLAGNDFIDGRGGFDTAQYNNMTYTTGGIIVNFAAGSVTGDASTGTDTLRSIEGIQGTNFADTFVATGYGLAGALNIGNNGPFNQFEGLAGNDTITGNGNTRLLYSNSTGGVTIHMAAGTADGDSSVGHDIFSGVYSVAGSNFADSYDATNFTGTSFGTYNEFQGQGGNDTVIGNGDTRIQFNNATGGVTVHMAAGTADGDASVGHDIFSGVFGALGSNFADVYDATNFTGISFGTYNEFQGQGGDDTITGNGNTQIRFDNATAGVTVDLVTGNATGDASVGHDTFTGVNSVFGSNFNDAIWGSSANESFDGGSGNDTINGGGGNDNLTGEGGADTFVYADGGGADIITDFNRAQGDTIDVRGVSGILTFADVQSRATLSGSSTIINFGSGNTLTLNGVASLQQSDFIFPTSFPTNGTSGGDVLLGTINPDTISGLDGNDVIKGLQGNDFIDGGQGRDGSDYSDATGSIYVDLALGVVSGDASVGADSLRSIEFIRGTNFADTYIAVGYQTPSPVSPLDIPIISSVSNTFEGGGGNDVIFGSAGTQASYSTGFGGTQISYADALDGVTVDLLAGTAHGTAANDVANVHRHFHGC
ncbi:MAG: beta strand repeat-containing protein, partial [Limisphaerales bacterium]